MTHESIVVMELRSGQRFLGPAKAVVSGLFGKAISVSNAMKEVQEDNKMLYNAKTRREAPDERTGRSVWTWLTLEGLQELLTGNFSFLMEDIAGPLALLLHGDCEKHKRARVNVRS